MVIRVLVHGLTGEVKSVDLCDTEEQFNNLTVLQLKQKIVEAGFCHGFDPERVRLIFTDSILLDDSSLLRKYGIQHMSVIQIVVLVTGGGGWDPARGDGGMGDKEGKNQSMERLSCF